MLIRLVLVALLLAGCNDDKPEVNYDSVEKKSNREEVSQVINTAPDAFKINHAKVFFNLNGAIASMVETSYEAKEKFGELEQGQFLSKNEQFFDENNREAKGVFYGNSGQPEKITWMYKVNDKGAVSYNQEGEEVSKSEYIADEKGWLVGIKLFAPDGTLTGHREFEQVDGYRTKITAYDADGNIQFMLKRKLDENNRPIQTEEFGKNGELKRSQTFENNEKGNPIKEVSSDAAGALVSEKSYQYKFDDHENWVERMTYENQKPVKITFREIEYR